MESKSAPVAVVLKRLRWKHGGRRAYSGSAGTAFECLIGAMLSHRTRDERTALAVERLFKKFCSPEKLAEARVAEITRLIKPVGFYRVKAKRVKQVARILVEKHGGRVPDSMKELLALPGVGRKTAGCVLVYAFNKPRIPVDTHVFRLSHRLDWSKAKTPEETEVELEQLIPKGDWIDVNNLLVLHGQNTCKPLKPSCTQCVLNDVCPSATKYCPKRS